MFSKAEYAAAETDARRIPTGSSPLQNPIRVIHDGAIRSLKVIDRLLDAFYLPANAQAQKKRGTLDKADWIRLHGLGVRW